MSDWEIHQTEAIGVPNPQACTEVIKPDSMSEEDFRVIITAWAGTSDFKIHCGKKLYLNEEEGRDFENYLRGLHQQKDKIIHINLWDDYYEDGYIPEGEKQETHMYVEESKFPLIDEKKVLYKVLDFIKKNIPKSVEAKLKLQIFSERYPNLKDSGMNLPDQWRIEFIGLTHALREKLLDSLKKSGLKYEDQLLYFYSES
jgi:hypothetical protein